MLLRKEDEVWGVSSVNTFAGAAGRGAAAVLDARSPQEGEGTAEGTDRVKLKDLLLHGMTEGRDPSTTPERGPR